MPLLKTNSGTHPDGYPYISLKYLMNQYDRENPRIIILKKMRRLRDSSNTRFPAYYCLDPGYGSRAPGIVIIAAPGVSIELSGFPSHSVATEENPRLDIFRVQSPRLVPIIGTPYSRDGLLSTYFIDNDPI